MGIEPAIPGAAQISLHRVPMLFSKAQKNRVDDHGLWRR